MKPRPHSENPGPGSDPVHPALVLGVYAEELAHAARVAIFGSAALGLAEELLLRGARLVHVYDPDVARVAEVSARRRDRSIFLAPLPDSGDVGVRDGAFDLVIVPDLSFVADPAPLLALARRVLSPAGTALIASPNADAESPLLAVPALHEPLGYYELYEAVAAKFASVRMIGQAPFVGYAVAEFSVDDPEPTIDTSLAESAAKEPDWFLVLASDRSVRLEPFVLVEVPVAAGFLADRGASASAVAGEISDIAPAPSLPSGPVLTNILEAERAAALESLRQQEQLVKEERARADRAQQELASAREELSLLRERCQSVERALEEEEGRRSSLEVELEGARRNPEIPALREQAASLREQETSLRDQAASLREQAATLRQEIASLREQEASLRGQETSQREQIASLRGQETSQREQIASLRGQETSQREQIASLRGQETSQREQIAVLRGQETSQREQIAVLRGQEASQREQIAVLRGQEASQREQIAVLRGQLASLQEQGAAVETASRDLAEDHEHDVSRLEAQLRERGKEVKDLKAEVLRRERLVRELLITSGLSAAEPPKSSNGHEGKVADLSGRLDRLANEAAKREADLVSAQWRIAQLERELTHQR